MDIIDQIPLEIIYDHIDDKNGSSANTSTYQGDYLLINTKDPAKFEQLYADASKKFMV
jgi:hypothetical protein